MTETLPGPTLGVIGGGQLGRMLAEAAAPIGVDVVVLDPTPDCPAARVADQVEGAFDDPDAVRTLAERADALSFEIELADPDLLATVGDEFDIPVHPDPETLRTIQDKFVQNEALANAGVPVPAYRCVDSPDDLATAVEVYDGVMLKARTGGYDGRGNIPVQPGDDPLAKLGEVVGDADFAGAALAEELVDFERELSVIGVKGVDEVRTFTVGENVHEAEILRETIVPAPTGDAVRKRAETVAREVLGMLDGRGVYGIEMFEVAGDILVNEIAPRPHNSGHWTIEGAVTSQFEQHVRAVLGWQLGATDRRCPTVSTNVLGDVDTPGVAELRGVDDVLRTPGAALHWYGKRQVRPLRKMGHVTVVPTESADPGATAETTATDAEREALLALARRLRDGLTFEPNREGNQDENGEVTVL